MKNPLTMKSWSPYLAGAGIGLLSWFAFATADRPIGVTTAFEYSAALAEKATVPQVEQTNEYFAKKEAEGKPPKIDWEWMLVIGVFLGAMISSTLSGDRGAPVVSPLWRWRFSDSAAKRLTAAFFAGVLMMFGARLAQGWAEEDTSPTRKRGVGTIPRWRVGLVLKRRACIEAVIQLLAAISSGQPRAVPADTELAEPCS